ncbi:MAG: ferredoxin family protein [Lachnospiraceae bacterium]
MPPIIDEKKCRRCGLCAQICGLDVFGPQEQGTVPAVRYPEDCWHCNSCVLDCPAKAIRRRMPLSMPLLHIEPFKSEGKV